MRIAMIVLIGLCFTACDSRKLSRLQEQNDSLANELASRDAMLRVIHQAAVLLDSIERRHGNIPNGDLPFHETFSVRLQQIHEHVKASEMQKTKMQKELYVSRNEASAYMMMVDAMKGEVDIRDGEIETLADSVDLFETHNYDLAENLSEKEHAIENLYKQIHEKQEKLAMLEGKVSDLARLTEAERYYARGRDVEASAERIRFAPAKRKETYREALELYKKSWSLGKPEARTKIINIQKIISLENTLVAEFNANSDSE
ncbi:MAG TPA: hypothetical protein VEB86_05610 [Chryseosolibacter sp.]|nr:hypothetical protein [Chryseosolibacter sp.]